MVMVPIAVVFQPFLQVYAVAMACSAIWAELPISGDISNSLSKKKKPCCESNRALSFSNMSGI